MKIYIAHSREFNYKKELYTPIRNDKKLKTHEIILPHEKNDILSNNREFYKEIDLTIAECSYPSIGLGIELGWIFDDNIPIYCIHKQGTKVSNSINKITQNIFEYTNIDEMINVIENIINNYKDKRI